MNVFNRHLLRVYHVYQAPGMCQARVHETQGPGSACKKGLEHLPLTAPECWLMWAERTEWVLGSAGPGLKGRKLTVLFGISKKLWIWVRKRNLTGQSRVLGSAGLPPRCSPRSVSPPWA